MRRHIKVQNFFHMGFKKGIFKTMMHKPRTCPTDKILISPYLMINWAVWFKFLLNETPGYHVHIWRPPILLKMTFERTVFFSENTFKFSNFSKFENWVFLQKNSQLRWKTQFKIKFIWYAFYGKFAALDFLSVRDFFFRHEKSPMNVCGKYHASD